MSDSWPGYEIFGSVSSPWNPPSESHSIPWGLGNDYFFTLTGSTTWSVTISITGSSTPFYELLDGQGSLVEHDWSPNTVLQLKPNVAYDLHLNYNSGGLPLGSDDPYTITIHGTSGASPPPPPPPPPPAHVQPTVTAVSSVSVNEGASIFGSSLIASIYNPSGDNITQYIYIDLGGSSGHFVVNGVPQPENQWIYPGTSDVVSYVGSSTPGTDTLQVGIYDYTTNSYSYSSTFPAVTIPPVTTPPPSAYAITPVSPTLFEDQGVQVFTVSRSNFAQAETVYVSTVHDQGNDNPNFDTFYQGILNLAVFFPAGVSAEPVVLTIHDLGLTSGNEDFRIIAQSVPTPLSDTTTGLLASDNFTIVNNDTPQSPGVAAISTYQFMYDALPSITETINLSTFSQTQLAYGQQLNVLGPIVYMYQAIGAALAEGSDTGAVTFTSTFGPSAIPSDTTFVETAYTDVFHHSGTSAQVQAFVDQVNFFKGLYLSSGFYGTDMNRIDLLARGAVLGQMLGVAVENPSTVGAPAAALVGVSATSDHVTDLIS